jgi:hypothetical protein
VRKLWALGPLVTVCAFGWRQGSATQAIGSGIAEGPLAGIVVEPGPSGAAERAVRRVVLRQAVRELIVPSAEWSEVPFLPSILEALVSPRSTVEPRGVGAEPGPLDGEPAPSTARQRWLASRGARAPGERAPSEALETLREVFDPGPVLH